MKTVSTKFAAVILLLCVMFIPQAVNGYCKDRPGSSYPNTGFCRLEDGIYLCLPGGITCDGDDNPDGPYLEE